MAKTRSQCRDSSLRHDRELVELVMSGIHKGWAVSMTDDGEVVFDIPADDDMEEDVSCDECDTDDDYDDDEEPEEAGTAAAPPRSKTAPRRSRCEGELVGGLETHELPDDDEAIHAVRAILGMLEPGRCDPAGRRQDSASTKVFVLGDGKRVRVTVEAE